MMTRMRLAAGWDHERNFPAEDPAEPMLTLPTARRLASKLRSKLSPATCAPSSDARLTGTATFVAPGSPEPLPAEREAIGVSAAVS
jgi:hypothetical protein